MAFWHYIFTNFNTLKLSIYDSTSSFLDIKVITFRLGLVSFDTWTMANKQCRRWPKHMFSLNCQWFFLNWKKISFCVWIRLINSFPFKKLNCLMHRLQKIVDRLNLILYIKYIENIIKMYFLTLNYVKRILTKKFCIYEKWL